MGFAFPIMRFLLPSLLLLVTACGADTNVAGPSSTVTVLGEWRGEWQPQTCVETNAPGGCSALAGGTIRMQLSGSLTEHEGTVTLGALVIPVTATSSATGGDVQLSGSTSEKGVTTMIANGQAVVAGTTITGSYTYTSAAADSVVTATVTFFGVKVGSSGGPSRTLP